MCSWVGEVVGGEWRAEGDTEEVRGEQKYGFQRICWAHRRHLEELPADDQLAWEEDQAEGLEHQLAQELTRKADEKSGKGVRTNQGAKSRKCQDK